MNLDVLFEDNHCLAVNKPAGLPSQGDESGSESLVDVVTRYLRERYGKPGNVYVGLAPSPRSADVGRRPAGQDQQGRRTALGAIPRGDDLESSTGRSWRGDRPRAKGNGSIDSKRTGEINRSRVLAEGDPEGKEARVAFRVLERAAGC